MVLGGSRFGLFGAAGSGGAGGAMYWTQFGTTPGYIAKWTYADDSRVVLADTLDYPTWGGAGVSNSGVAGYQLGGANTPQNRYVQKLTYATEAASTLGSPTNLIAATYDTCGFSNSGTAGYSGGGCCYTDIYHKVAFPSETVSTLGATMDSSRGGVAAMSNSGTAGYVTGGYIGPASATVDKLTYSTDASSVLGTGLSEARFETQTISNVDVFGYAVGGQISNVETPSAWRSDGDKFAFPSDTRTALSTGFLSGTRSYGSGGSNSGVAGYIGGGNIKWAMSSVIDKFEFPSDTRTTLAAGVSQTANSAVSMSNQEALW